MFIDLAVAKLNLKHLKTTLSHHALQIQDVTLDIAMAPTPPWPAWPPCPGGSSLAKGVNSAVAPRSRSFCMSWTGKANRKDKLPSLRSKEPTFCICSMLFYKILLRVSISCSAGFQLSTCPSILVLPICTDLRQTIDYGMQLVWSILAWADPTQCVNDPVSCGCNRHRMS